ncbi:MAG: type II toxin-antitoxin system RelE/ParE family toxin [Deltaproteobacteria bacterium]|uniref:Type II toxin-antitoxin system RelE/ParE family toxin n=1 Tax=Candidatus Desulfacyla euxinica TaxID=2841693 RepID=A0A8J6MZM0_9DELT|nr:type II toxin-antitoxin system RelE/ParE family toxin [Candidatus Desulfacyla euxinica]MBL7217932.1 type II toxin-antitoxin system RelE/ParE family toxin [Desulfobacteraceae bacterium]
MIEITDIIQSPLFASQKKRLHKKQIRDLDEAIRKIAQGPEIGSLKVGDLSSIRVFKFNSMNSLILLAYEIVENTLFLYTFGSHQNFYRELKKHINR